MSTPAYPTVPAKTLVTRTKSTEWFGSEYNMNIYRGCPHGCIYCDSRSDCYRNPDFDTVKVKEDALRIIRDDLRRKVKIGVIATGAMSDPYNPLEAELELTRHALELAAAYGFGIAIATKSPLVTRDIDILGEIALKAPVIVKMTVTTADDDLCRKIEPGVAPSSRRLDAVKQLRGAGIYAGLLMMPILPYINDTEANTEGILTGAKDSGARFIYPAFGLTMRDGQREYLYNQLDRRFPGLRETYQRRYGTRYYCPSPRAKQLYHHFAARCDELGLLYNMRGIISDYKMGYEAPQMRLF